MPPARGGLARVAVKIDPDIWRTRSSDSTRNRSPASRRSAGGASSRQMECLSGSFSAARTWATIRQGCRGWSGVCTDHRGRAVRATVRDGLFSRARTAAGVCRLRRASSAAGGPQRLRAGAQTPSRPVPGPVGEPARTYLRPTLRRNEERDCRPRVPRPGRRRFARSPPAGA